MTKIAFISREGFTHPETEQWIPGGTTHLRAVLPARALHKYGKIDTLVTHSFGQDQHTGEIHPRIRHADGSWELWHGWDVIVLLRWMNAAGTERNIFGNAGYGDDLATITQKAQACGQLVVQDLDDWLWGIPTTNQGFYNTHPKVAPLHNVNHYKKGLSKASLITVSTPYLAERLEKLGPPIKVLPNMIDLSTYTAQPVRPGPARTVGWTGSTVYRGGDLEVLKGILGPFMARHGLTFIHGGHSPNCPPAADMLGLHPSTPVEQRREVPPDLYPTLFDGIDIFVAPLADRPFNQAKSACKVMEASAAGIPYIASRVGPYVDYDQSGMLAQRPKEWLRQLERLIQPHERHVIAQRQRVRVEREDVSLRWSDWLNAYARN